jgi:hypothetical protein
MEVQHFVAGWNMTGYLPDPEHVLHGLTLEEAMAYLKDELERAADQDADRDQAEEFDAARERIDSWDTSDMEARARIHGVGAGDNYETAGGHRYWVHACLVLGCTQVNTEE